MKKQKKFFTRKRAVVAASAMVIVMFTGCASLLGLSPKTFETYSVTATAFGELAVSWNEVRGAVGYIVYMAEAENGAFTEVRRVRPGARPATTIEGLRGGTTYWFKVTAELKKEEMTESGTFSGMTLREVAPAKPVSLRLTSTEPAGVRASWDRVIGEESYNVYISTTAQSGFRRASTNLRANVFAFTDLQPNTTYFVRLAAVNRFGTSPQSDSVEVRSGRSAEEIEAARAAVAAAAAEREAAERAEREARQAAERERLERERPGNEATVAQLRRGSGIWAGNVTVTLGGTTSTTPTEYRFIGDNRVNLVQNPGGDQQRIHDYTFTVTGGGTTITINRVEMQISFTGNTFTLSGGGINGASFRGMFTRR